MTTYVSSSYSLSSAMFSYILAQMPRHSPQPVEHPNSALEQEQRRVSHPILQLHRTTFSSAFGATSMSHCMGTSLPSTVFQPRLCGCRCGLSLDSPSIFAPEGTHGGYGTWQLMMSEEDFPAAQTVYWWLPSDESAPISIYLVCHPLHMCTSHRPAWSEMMQMVHTGDHAGQSSVLLLPMLDLDHGNMSCVHSTLKFKCEHAARYNVTPIITFDQPLWWKSLQVIEGQPDNNPLRFIVLRLGGFHTETSFNGSIVHLM